MVKVLVLVVLLAGCTTARGTFCEIAEPYRLSEKTVEVMTDEEVRKAVAHNEKGQKLCGWRP